MFSATSPLDTADMSCPLCHSRESGLLRNLAPNAVAQRWLAELGIEVGSEFTNLPEIRHWLCQNCGFSWYTPETAAAGPELYSQLERFPWYYMTDKWEFRQALKFLAPGDKVLEVGAGAGHFLLLAQYHGCTVAGVELNPKAAAKATAAGFSIWQEDLATLAEMQAGSFSAVCCFQVLEHVVRPLEFISNMLALLQPGGLLMISVPNAKVLRRIDPNFSNLLDQPPHHISHWDAGVFQSLEQILPVKLRLIEYEPLQPYHVRWFTTSFLRRPFGAWLRRILINRITTLPVTIPLHLGLRKYFRGHTLFVGFEKP